VAKEQASLILACQAEESTLIIVVSLPFTGKPHSAGSALNENRVSFFIPFYERSVNKTKRWSPTFCIKNN
jgi:hypothetical protein